MIRDRIDNLDLYDIPFKDKIIQFLHSHDPKLIPDGEHEIDGRNLFVRVMSTLKGLDENIFETHRIYADLQYVVLGEELMQIVPSDQLVPNIAYNSEGDYQFFTASKFISDLVFRNGDFAVFFPGEAHRPSNPYQNFSGPYKKLVFKIKI
jgi:biofilm protein TabA